MPTELPVSDGVQRTELPPEFQAALAEDAAKANEEPTQDAPAEQTQETAPEQTEETTKTPLGDEKPAEQPPAAEETPGGDDGLSWQEEMKLASDLGVYKPGMTRSQVQAKILRATRDQKAQEESFGELRQTAKEVYGLSDADISRFTGPDELERTLSILDRQILSSVQETPEQTPPAPMPQQTQVPLPQKPPATQPPPTPEAIQKHLAKLAEVMGEEEVAPLGEAFQAVLGEVAAVRDQMNYAFAQEQANRQVQHFYALCDSLNDPLLGQSSVGLTPDQEQRRKAVGEATFTWLEGMGARGRPIEMTRSLVQRQHHVVHSADIQKLKDQERAELLRKQNGQKLGSGSRRRATSEVFEGPLEEDPELLAAFDRLAEGSAALE